MPTCLCELLRLLAIEKSMPHASGPSHAQIAEFAGNAVELQGSDRLVLALSTRSLACPRATQRHVPERHAELLPLSIPTIERARGSVRCMIAGLHLTQRSEPSVGRIPA